MFGVPYDTDQITIGGGGGDNNNGGEDGGGS